MLHAPARPPVTARRDASWPDPRPSTTQGLGEGAHPRRHSLLGRWLAGPWRPAGPRPCPARPRLPGDGAQRVAQPRSAWRSTGPARSPPCLPTQHGAAPTPRPTCGPSEGARPVGLDAVVVPGWTWSGAVLRHPTLPPEARLIVGDFHLMQGIDSWKKRYLPPGRRSLDTPWWRPARASTSIAFRLRPACIGMPGCRSIRSTGASPHVVGPSASPR